MKISEVKHPQRIKYKKRRNMSDLQIEARKGNSARRNKETQFTKDFENESQQFKCTHRYNNTMKQTILNRIVNLEWETKKKRKINNLT